MSWSPSSECVTRTAERMSVFPLLSSPDFKTPKRSLLHSMELSDSPTSNLATSLSSQMTMIPMPQSGRTIQAHSLDEALRGRVNGFFNDSYILHEGLYTPLSELDEDAFAIAIDDEDVNMDEEEEETMIIVSDKKIIGVTNMSDVTAYTPACSMPSSLSKHHIYVMEENEMEEHNEDEEDDFSLQKLNEPLWITDSKDGANNKLMRKKLQVEQTISEMLCSPCPQLPKKRHFSEFVASPLPLSCCTPVSSSVSPSSASGLTSPSFSAASSSETSPTSKHHSIISSFLKCKKATPFHTQLTSAGPLSHWSGRQPLKPLKSVENWNRKKPLSPNNTTYLSKSSLSGDFAKCSFSKDDRLMSNDSLYHNNNPSHERKAEEMGQENENFMDFSNRNDENRKHPIRYADSRIRLAGTPSKTELSDSYKQSGNSINASLRSNQLLSPQTSNTSSATNSPPSSPMAPRSFYSNDELTLTRIKAIESSPSSFLSRESWEDRGGRMLSHGGLARSTSLTHQTGLQENHTEDFSPMILSSPTRGVSCLTGKKPLESTPCAIKFRRTQSQIYREEEFIDGDEHSMKRVINRMTITRGNVVAPSVVSEFLYSSYPPIQHFHSTPLGLEDSAHRTTIEHYGCGTNASSIDMDADISKCPVPSSPSFHPVADTGERYQLPFDETGRDALKRIVPDTLIRLIEGDFDHIYDEKFIIDCRFPYEYQGGHIRTAVNINSMNELEELLLSHSRLNSLFSNVVANESQDIDAPETRRPKRVVLVFHCEFSSHRAPRMALYLRKRDRMMNMAHYPRLFYPEIYILKGGYRDFYHQYKVCCFPQSYVEMNHSSFRTDLRRQMTLFKKSWKRCKSFSADLHSDEDDAV